MQEIYYPDGSVGLVSDDRIENIKHNPDLNVVNPKGSRASSKHNLLVNLGGEHVKIKVGLWKVDKHDIQKVDPENRKMRDSQGRPVFRKEYDVMTGNDIEKRGTRYKTEDGTEIPFDDIRWFIDTPEGEKEISKFEKTEDIQITFKPSGIEDSYVIKDTYEVVPESEEDNIALWGLVRKLKENNEIGIGLVVHQRGWDKYGILLVPYVDEKNDKYALLAKTTSKKFGLTRPQAIPKGKSIRKKAEAPTSAEELFT